jgi:(E)-4-hydroxy-3-methylbut-2-enyl-diphosphate synthase
MVESALEFLDVCEDEGYRDVVFSMKASNTQVAIQAYRMLAARLAERDAGPGAPFHVGVTEAGDGEDGRIKSAIGIGALLADGIGDTIRVSLTEAPEKEVPVAQALARLAEQSWAAAPPAPPDPGDVFCEDPYVHRRRATRSIATGGACLGGANPVRVELDLGPVPAGDPAAAARALADALSRTDRIACEGLLVESLDPTQGEQVLAYARALRDVGLELPLAVRAEACWVDHCAPVASRLVVPLGELVSDEHLAQGASCIRARGLPLEWELRARPSDVVPLVDRALQVCGEAGIEDFLFSFDAEYPVHTARLAVARLRECGAADVPIVLRHRGSRQLSQEDDLLRAATHIGALLCDGIGDMVSIAGELAPDRALDLAYRVLQGARLRTTWTEFISCPSCGRTLFDLEETTALIKLRTQHLSGVKIAIMGCIVNGPGEMADADFGYVGSGPGLVNLYVGKECVARQIPATVAADRLVDLIKEHGLWADPA